MASSNVDSIKRDFDFSHSQILKNMEAYRSRLHKRFKVDFCFLLFRSFICDTYFKKYPARIGFLRVDTLSLILSFSNVTANSDVLVVDMIGGLITGAIAERLEVPVMCAIRIVVILHIPLK
ncbi:hypothetical protein L2E82_20642 [Cichorium intybus]|uniref:Uncharacterized protein n=1 Tax=Cichorium intybus TaxID=13427 RepID=A0ACB9DUN5_CICIN|nr:hypothetical protein L2E82_20642 [Cichorium intybus]